MYVANVVVRVHYELTQFFVVRVDYIIAPLKILQSLKESLTFPDEKYSFVRRMSPSSATAYSFSEEEVKLVVFLFQFWKDSWQ